MIVTDYRPSVVLDDQPAEAERIVVTRDEFDLDLRIQPIIHFGRLPVIASGATVTDCQTQADVCSYTATCYTDCGTCYERGCLTGGVCTAP